MTAHITDAVAKFRQSYDSEIIIHTHNHAASAGERITHLAVDPVLSHAWINLTGEPFRPHHAATLMAMRRQEHVAIVSANPRRTLSLICMTINVLLESPTQRAILLVQDESAAMALYREIIAFIEKFSHDTAIMPVIVTDTTGPMMTERLFIVTYDALHRRLLGYHDRAWRGVWQSVCICGLVDIHMSAGIGMYHLAAMLKRIQRITNQFGELTHMQYIATVIPARGLDRALEELAVGTWKMVHANDYACEPSTTEVWDCPADALQVVQSLAHDLSAQGYSAHLWVRDPIQPLFEPIDVHSNVTMASRLWPAQVLIMAGVSDDRWRIPEAIQAGYTMIIVVLGMHPIDRWYATHPEKLLDTTPLAWPTAALNAYVLTQHLRAAAYEIPLRADEIRDWYATELRDRLVERGQLLALPDQQWGVAGDDNVYEDFHMLSAIGLPVLMKLDDMLIDTPFDPTGFERWLAKGSSVPPWHGGLRVIQRNDDDAIVTLQRDVAMRRTMPLRSSTVAIRDSKETFMLARGVLATFGRVLVTESVDGVREVRDGVVKDHTLSQPLESRWSAPAWWIDIPTYVHTDAQAIGWSVVLALPVLSLFTTAAVVPCADVQFGRLYFVDAQPGGNGASEWMFDHIDVVLQTALQIAHHMQHDDLYAQSATNDGAWLQLVTPMPVRHTEAQPVVTLPPVSEQNLTHEDEGAHIDEPTSPYPVIIPGPNPVSDTDVTAPLKAVPASPVPVNRRAWQQRTRANRPLIPEVPTPAPARTVPPRTLPVPSRSEGTDRPAPTVPPARQTRGQSTRNTAQTPPTPKTQNASTRVSREETTPDTGAPDSGVPNVNRIMENLRRQIKQKLPGGVSTPEPQVSARSGTDVHRFQPGQRIFCLPYGDGEIVDSFFVDGREFIRVEFPNYGELKIDPSLSLVKVLNDNNPASDTD